jgi:hypothetical protein
LVVKERLAHEDIRTTMNAYGHLFPGVGAVLAEAFDAHMNWTPPTVEAAELRG